jgi:hypothetical protein
MFSRLWSIHLSRVTADSTTEDHWYVAVFANDATAGNYNRIVGCGEVQLQVSWRAGEVSDHSGRLQRRLAH